MYLLLEGGKIRISIEKQTLITIPQTSSFQISKLTNKESPASL